MYHIFSFVSQTFLGTHFFSGTMDEEVHGVHTCNRRRRTESLTPVRFFLRFRKKISSSFYSSFAGKVVFVNAIALVGRKVLCLFCCRLHSSFLSDFCVFHQHRFFLFPFNELRSGLLGSRASEEREMHRCVHCGAERCVF